MGKKYVVDVGPAVPGETAPKRNAGAAKEERTTLYNIEGLDTVYKLVQYCIKKYETRQCMGSRKILKAYEEEKEITRKVDGKEVKAKKTWQYYELSPFSYITYKQLGENITDIASGLIKLGLKPNGEERFHVYAQTSADWMQTALACNSQGIPVVTAYDTLGEEGLMLSMTQTHTVGVFLDNYNIRSLINPLKQATEIRIVIHKDALESDNEKKAMEELVAAHPHLKHYSLDEIKALGKENPVPASPPDPDDTALIMYTSGSSGTPKGVVLLNKGVAAGVAGVTGIIDQKVVLPGDRLLAFLPLAHILEFTFELAALAWGAVLGYGNPKTVSETSVRNSVGDIREFKPNIMVGVPAVWEGVRKGIMAGIKSQPALTQKLFWAAYNLKLKMASYGVHYFPFDFIFKRVREATGGQLRFVFSGGAALSQDTQVFISNLIAPLVLGYGLTETNANAAILHPGKFEYGTVGELAYAVTAKLVDASELGYFAKNNQGELWLRGLPVSPHYYENEKETTEAYTEDGWFKTGDICEFLPNGHLKIIDRKKSLVKTLKGEYIAVEKLESVYRHNQYVANICIYVDSGRVKPVAIIVPMENALKDLCNELGVDYHDDVAHEPVVKKAIYKSLIDTARANNLKSVEQISGVVVSRIEWTPQNGYLTSAQKLQRKMIVDNVREELDETK